jgi:Protease subunit of ATP-dependent Clp proteases
LANIKSENIILHLNSPGGDVFDGLAIYNLLKNSGKNITVMIEGLAASIASVVAMCGDKIIMSKSAMMMIHNPFISITGDSDRLKKTAETIDMIKSQLVEIYSLRSKMETKDVEDLMTAETWMTAETCKKKGFCDEVSESLKIAAFASIDQYEFRNKAIFENLKKKLKKSEETMEMSSVAQLLGVTDDKVLDTIKAMQQKIEDSEKNLSDLQEKLNEQIVVNAIAKKKILPAQKDFALKMLATGDDTYQAWLDQNKPQLPSDPITIPGADGTPHPVTYNDLLDDPELYEKYYTENRSEFDKMKAKFEKGEK